MEAFGRGRLGSGFLELPQLLPGQAGHSGSSFQGLILLILFLETLLVVLQEIGRKAFDTGSLLLSFTLKSG